MPKAIKNKEKHDATIEGIEKCCATCLYSESNGNQSWYCLHENEQACVDGKYTEWQWRGFKERRELKNDV